MTPKRKKRLSRILIGTGLLIIAVVLIFEASIYPWRLLFSQTGLVAPQTLDSLAEPAPLPESLLVKELPARPEPDERDEQGDALAELEAPAHTFTRPAVDLYQIGRIQIPKISLSENLVSGTGNELYYGVGHVTFSALPGQEGNCALAAHRNLIHAHAFRHLDKLEEGDQITITSGDEVYTYTVYSVFTVDPDETWVLKLQQHETHMLTLVTCTPAIRPTHRLIVWARLDR